MVYKIKHEAIFIGDSHANTNKLQFRKFLEFINSQKTLPTQIFFLGDMFDFLANTTYTQKFYQYEINLINEISQKTQIFYFEGNHDFNLAEIFPSVKVFSHYDQPASFKTEFGEILQISHGDIFLPKITQISLLFLRNRQFLKFMNFIDKICKFKISKAILKSQENKILYKKAENFMNFIKPKIHNYNAKIVVEGHYHQDEILKFENQTYINLNSFAVTQKIYKFDAKSNKFDEFFVNLNLKQL
ncbi:MAG: UDP-2,3-diacylglucosamine diphosphatase [Campylobacter sp.]|nr:UDP-2,3-diacylglucosamine diphosphatase [Campylobacter sp.]MBQ7675595.1 UDP-2,3-diacylglucosamine diphosphatase [Campylobacter sp.]